MEKSLYKHCSSNLIQNSSCRNRGNKNGNNLMVLLQKRELQENECRTFSRRTQILRSAIDRLGVLHELEGHRGCVNCIEFNEAGEFLISGSDDFSIMLWDVHKRKLMKSIATGHRGNIFSVKFLPQTNDNLIVSGAGDHRLEVREVSSGEVTQVCTCHSERVKRIATVPAVPYLYFSASEDGTVMQFDTRVKHTCCSQPNNVLINLKQHAGRTTECKCVAVNPLRSELLAVGASDPFVRVYDRRMINLTSIQYPPDGSSRTSWDRRNYAVSQLDPSTDNLEPGCVQFYVPGHLTAKMRDYHKKYRSLATTYLSYSSDGKHLLANLGGDHIYIFDTLQSEPSKQFTVPAKASSNVQKVCLVAQPNGVCRVAEPTNGYSSHSTTLCNDDNPQSMPAGAEVLRLAAHRAYTAQDYITALEIYNTAIHRYDNIAHFYSARAATLLKRKWDGDIYAALRDYNKAIELDPNNIKAKSRQVRCLDLLGRERKEARSNSGSDSDREEDGFIVPSISEKEKAWRTKAKDYEKVYCGHCNTTTDIKEAVFVGKNGDFIAAGSDDGNLFIWNRHTTNLARVIEADKSIVNCVQSHPNICMLVTSGIETVVKLWAPIGEKGSIERTNGEKLLKITRENQQRMSTDPMEMMYLQMGELGEFIEGRRRLDASNDFYNVFLTGQSNDQCSQS